MKLGRPGHTLREWLWPNALRTPHYVARHRLTHRTPLAHHAWEVVVRYRTEHPWAGVVADVVANTGEFARIITVTAA